MNLKDSKTIKNIEAALKGESLARNKYTFYAMKAKEDGDEEIAELFEEMAKNETVHAKLWFKLLHDGLGETKDNLQKAASGEFDEWSDMYPQFARAAREEGFEEIADMFSRVAQIEKSHEMRFLKAYASYVAKKGAASSEAEKRVEEKTRETHSVPGYRCMFCGAEYETRPDVCSVCKAIGSFQNCTIEK